MLMPSDFKEKIAENRRNLQQGEKAIISIESQPGEDSDQDLLDLDWELKAADEAGVEFKLIFNQPLEVSQNDQPDKVKVMLNLDSYTDEFGQSMGNTTMLIEVPRQIPSETEAAAIESGGESTEVGSSSVMGGNFILNLILAASLN